MSQLPLLTHLETEQRDVDAFIRLLEAEQRALIDNTLSDLVELVKQKNALAQSLSELAVKRKPLLELNGVEISPHPPHEIVSAKFLPAEHLPTLSAMWLKLLQSARQANALNETNGKLIDTRQQQNQQMMALIQASTGAASVLSYDAYGQARLSTRTGSLGKA